MKTNDLKPLWERARNLLAGMRSHSRRRLAAQILLGKEIFEIKLKAGICGAGGDRRSKVQVGPLKTEEQTWDTLCRKELGISRQTANRYIVRYEKAAEFAKTLPEAGNILLADFGNLTGTEVETLAAFVEKLVDKMTAAELEVEPDEADEDETESDSGAGDFQETLEQEALIFFASIPRKIDAIRKALGPFRDHGKYHLYLHKLPLDDGRDGKPSLNGIKKGLEAILNDGLGAVLDDLREAIKAKSTGTPQKPSRAKSRNLTR
jgi:hypothetical protein